MKNKILFPFLLFIPFSFVFCQTPVMKKIPGESRYLGGGYQYIISDYRILLMNPGQDDRKDCNEIAIGEIPDPNNTSGKYSVSSYFISETEVTNEEYLIFLLESLFNPAESQLLLKTYKNPSKFSNEEVALFRIKITEAAGSKDILPDTLCWSKDFTFGYNEPLVHEYFLHPAFKSYPVVGVSYLQAISYCNWLTRRENKVRTEKGLPLLPGYRLPTEIEWEFAARGEMNRKKNTGIENKTTSEKEEEIKTDFPWDAQFSNATHSRGKYFANIKTGPSNYIEDNYEYTAPVKSFPANTFGLFEMAGNVSEWTADVFEFHHSPETANISPAQIPNDAQNLRVVKGGSWADYKYAAMCGSRTGLDGNKGYARVGFRVARNNED